MNDLLRCLLVLVVLSIGCNQMNRVDVKKGDRFRAVIDIKTHGLTHWLGAPVTGSFECTIPKGTILVVQNDPPVNAKGVYVLPEQHEEFELQWVPEDERTDPQYGGYSFVLLFDDIGKLVVRDAL